MKIQVLFSTAALVFSVTAGMAATSDVISHQRADFYAPGKHQFYVWCTGGQDRIITQAGLSAKDAETKLSEKLTGPVSCRLSWQGRIQS